MSQAIVPMHELRLLVWRNVNVLLVVSLSGQGSKVSGPALPILDMSEFLVDVSVTVLLTFTVWSSTETSSKPFSLTWDPSRTFSSAMYLLLSFGVS